MKVKMVSIIVVCIATIVIVSILNKHESVEKKQEVIAPKINLSGIDAQIELDPFQIENVIDEYLTEHEIICENAIVLDYRYEDLDTADVVYDIYFQLDDHAKTIFTLVYGIDEQKHKKNLKVEPCAFSREEIENQIWYEEEKQ